MLGVRGTDEHRPELVDRPDPEPGEGEVLVEVRGTAINRADLLQLRGLYPPPPGESEIPGLECVGYVSELGAGGVGRWKVGDRVAALLAGGGHAERVAVPVGQLLPLPAGWSWVEGAALMESAITAWTNLVVEGRLVSGERVLISGATGGVGSYAVQLARALGGEVIVASRPSDRLDDLVARSDVQRLALGDREATGDLEASVDLALDFVGGEWLDPLLSALRPQGRLILVGILAGDSAEITLGRVLRHRLQIVGSVLRSRSRAEKTELVEGFARFAEPHFQRGDLRPLVAATFPFDEIDRAYSRVRAGSLLGKVVVERSL